MAVTKRTRFEVLRRDDHTCQYCGAKAPDVTLQIDHVMPVALGGDDKPGNLITACKDCNAGKSSIQPDSPLVQGLSGKAAAYALGMTDKMTRFRADMSRNEEYTDSFKDEWESWRRVGTENTVPLPPDYQSSVWRWAQMGIPSSVFEMAIAKAMSKQGIRGEFGVFQYMAGIIARMIDDREIDYTVTDETAAVFTQGEVENLEIDSWLKGKDYGYNRGVSDVEISHLVRDFVQHHIDQTYMVREPSTYDPDQMILTGGVRRRVA